MIKSLEIENFKSIKHLKLDCKKINIFIGKPNTGKSNILEGIGLLSLPSYYTPSRKEFSYPLKDLIRFESMTNLFYDNDLGTAIKITADDVYCEIEFGNNTFTEYIKKGDYLILNFGFNYNGALISESITSQPLNLFKFYRFTVIDSFPRTETEFLLPPRGENLLSILLTNKDLRRLASEILKEYGLRIVLKPQEQKMEVQKEIEDIIISFPYSIISDSIQRLIFHLAAIETNKDSIIALEEPESHSFPFYTKFLAERIGIDGKNNQYFISTHNPYFLLPLLEKTPKEDIGIFITYLQDYQTLIKPLTDEEIQELFDLDSSLFLNLDRYINIK